MRTAGARASATSADRYAACQTELKLICLTAGATPHIPFRWRAEPGHQRPASGSRLPRKLPESPQQPKAPRRAALQQQRQQPLQSSRQLRSSRLIGLQTPQQGPRQQLSLPQGPRRAARLLHSSDHQLFSQWPHLCLERSTEGAPQVHMELTTTCSSLCPQSCQAVQSSSLRRLQLRAVPAIPDISALPADVREIVPAAQAQQKLSASLSSQQHRPSRALAQPRQPVQPEPVGPRYTPATIQIKPVGESGSSRVSALCMCQAASSCAWQAYGRCCA